MNDFIHVYDNVFSEDDCNEFIEYIDKIDDHSLMIQVDGPIHIVNQKGLNFVHRYDLSCWSWIGEKFFPPIQDCIGDYLNTFSILNEDKFMLYDVKAKKIPPGGGFHRWHYENSTMSSLQRYFVLQLYLNTIDEGGETEFLYVNKRVNAKTGRLVIFPAAFTHTHRGNPPIGQTKYILTSWGLLQGQQ